MSTAIQKRGRIIGDAVACSGLLLLILAAFHKVWLRGQLFFDGDLALYYGPNLKYAAQRLGQGDLPLWNPFLYAGTPFIANPQTGTFYPPNWIGLLAPVEWCVTLLGMAHLALAACLMYAFCRKSLQLDPLAAFAGAATFSSAGSLPDQFEHTAILMSGSWLPGIILACHQAAVTRRRVWHLLAAGMLGLAILAGGIQFVFLICVAVVAFFLFDSICPFARDARDQRNHPSAQDETNTNALAALTRRLRGGASSVATVALVTAGVGCAQLLPTALFIPASQRSEGMDVASASIGSLRPVHALILSISPHFFGHHGNTWWRAWIQHEHTMYLGLVPLSLLPLGLVGSLRRKEGIFLGLLGGLSLLVAFGTYTAAFSLAYRFLPGLAYFRVPARFLFLFCFAAAALGAIGLDHLMRAGPSRRIWFQVGLAALWVLFGIWGFHALNRPELVERVASLGYGDSDVIRGVQLLQLCRSVSGVREYYGRLYLETLTLGGLGVVAIFVLSRRPKLGRILVVAVLCLDVLGFSRGRAPWALAGAGSEYLQASNWLQQVQELRNDAQYRSHLPKPILAPNLGMLHDLPVGDGYCSFLPQARHTALMTARDEQDPTFAHRLAELFAVGYELEKPAKPNQEDAPLVRRNNVPPRARLAVHAEQASTATQALERTLAGDFDPWQEVVVEQYSSSRRESDERKLDTLAGANDGGSAQSSEQRVRWVVDEPERLRIELDTLQDAWLVVSDAHWPGWKAMVNGQEQQIYRANYYFRAVRVPAGHSTVEMRYADHSMWLGIPVTVLSAMGILVALGLSRNRSLGASNAPLTTPTRPSHARPSLW